ncbi:MAG: alpha/beta hydrolase [Ruminococcus sp.]|nr:alpha/beta hydrolase [Anaerobutyricum hallii]MDD6105054.1 alpha/beta hydrolase [Ruminococcus sp.]MDD6589165.1 alpha/beta hydrolase [Anaerobutyricum hallii]MDY4579494.1 alpha/beta hydrolase [Anaerobutyricum hallii]MEE1483400.1 alpha/beta hydrolase [Anaerobutyricum hallii]HJH96871.1 alpha/beta hydrolase [Anaerobutyricum hallii]
MRMNRRNLGTSSGRREKAVDKSAMERMVRQNRARRKKRRKDKSISLAATMSKNVIALATSLHGIGPLIQNGTFRKRVAEIEPPWHPPRGFSLVPIEMPDFSMELLLHQNEFFSNNSLEYLKTDDSNMPEDRAGKEDTAERLLTENREVVLQLHGGGYIGKMKNAYRDFAVLYARMPGERAVLSVDYRVAPEDPYPAALEDAYAAYQWLLEMGCRGSQIIVAGDSAGGGLALALCLYLKDKGEPLPKKLVLMSPWTDLAATGDSYETNFEKDPLFGNTTDSMIYSNAYYGENDPKTPYISPLYGNYEGFPPMLFQVGGSEMLLSDSARAAKKAKAAGCEVQLTIYDEMFHVFQLGMKKMKESREAWKEIEEFLTI